MARRRIHFSKDLIPGITAFIILFVDIALRNRDQFDHVTGNIYFRILVSVLTSAPFIVFATFKKAKEVRLADRIILIVASLFPFLTFFVGQLRQYILIVCIYTMVIGLALITVYMMNTNKNGGSIVFTYSELILFYVTMMLFNEGVFTTFVNDGVSWAFFGVAMIIALIAVALRFVIIKVKKQGDEENKPKMDKLITNSLLLLFLSGMVIWTLLLNLNYALDEGPKDVDVYEIVDMDVSGGRAHNYFIYIRIDGKDYQFDVSSDDYYDVEKGDYVYVSYYEGFFGAPFFKLE